MNCSPVTCRGEREHVRVYVVTTKWLPHVLSFLLYSLHIQYVFQGYIASIHSDTLKNISKKDSVCPYSLYGSSSVYVWTPFSRYPGRYQRCSPKRDVNGASLPHLYYFFLLPFWTNLDLLNLYVQPGISHLRDHPNGFSPAKVLNGRPEYWERLVARETLPSNPHLVGSSCQAMHP